MARKQPKKTEMEATVEPPVEAKLKPVRLDLSPEAHRLLRLIAADEEMSMSAYARMSYEAFLRDEAKRRGIKP